MGLDLWDWASSSPNTQGSPRCGFQPVIQITSQNPHRKHSYEVPTVPGWDRNAALAERKWAASQSGHANLGHHQLFKNRVSPKT